MRKGTENRILSIIVHVLIGINRTTTKSDYSKHNYLNFSLKTKCFQLVASIRLTLNAISNWLIPFRWKYFLFLKNISKREIIVLFDDLFSERACIWMCTNKMARKLSLNKYCHKLCCQAAVESYSFQQQNRSIKKITECLM